MRKRKSPAKGIILSDEKWLRKVKVKEERDKLLLEQEGKCAISTIPIETGALDHDHETGLCRGVLLSEVNMLEGRYLKLFNKLKLSEKYGISFSGMLISMGEYLNKDYSSSKLHYGLMESYRKKISRLTKPVLQDKLLSEYGIISVGDKKELVRLYVQAWVNALEE